MHSTKVGHLLTYKSRRFASTVSITSVIEICFFSLLCKLFATCVFFDDVIFSFLEFQLVAERAECAGNKIGECRKSSAADCASSCKNVSSMISFGRQGSDMCNSQGMCRCYCQLEAANGSCTTQKSHQSFDLYKYWPQEKSTPEILEHSYVPPSKWSVHQRL